MVMRCLPFFYNGNGDIINIVAMDDPMYNLRQLEVVLHNSFEFPWYDPMTLMPTGMYPHWGPLFIYILAMGCLLTGATTLPAIITTSLFIPPFMCALMVPVTYVIVKKAFDWKTGLIAALFISTITGQYFARGLFGYLDHHIAEVLFGSIFCMIYMLSITETTNLKINFGDRTTLKKPILYGVLSGIAFLSGFLIMPTMILFGFIVMIYTLLIFTISIKYDVNRELLLIVNTLTFGIPTIGFFLLGYPVVSWFQLSHYSLAHPLVWGVMIATTIILYLASSNYKKITSKASEFASPVLIFGGIIFVAILLFRKYINDIIQGSIIADSIEFFGQSAVVSTVQEARAWGAMDAWNAFNFFIILSFIGLITLTYLIFTKKKGEHIFLYVWAIVMLIATIQHIRYEYYLAINLAILSSVGAGYFLRNIDFTFITQKFARTTTKLTNLETVAPRPEGKNKPKSEKQKNTKPKSQQQKNTKNYLAFAGLCIVGAISALAIFGGITFGLAIGQSSAIRLNPDWKESLIWLEANSPDTGVDYYEVYDGSKFQYPPTAYGVMSWWDYGHMITFISHRIPNANPFQAGVYGNYSSSSFFMASSEERANEILDNLKTKYIITDTEMATGKFWAMATWYNPKLGQEPYIKQLVVPKSPMSQELQLALGYTLDYYSTMITRLHVLDGTAYNVQEAIYVEYDPSTHRVISANQMSLRDAMVKALQLQESITKTKLEAIISPNPLQPIGKQNALTHYRLIHESPTSTITGNGIDIKYVKIFEYVKGYVYRPTHEGILFAEQTITTNTGRKFNYIQEISGTEFTLPYSGTYTITDTSGNVIETITISEEDVVNGNKSYPDETTGVCVDCASGT